MNQVKINTENPLRERQHVVALLNEMLSAVTPYTEEGKSGIDLGHFTTHYGKQIAKMEALSRMLWGIFPLLATGEPCENLSFYITAIRNGTYPSHAEYWGEIGDSDQRCVEMAAFGVGLALLDKRLLAYFSAAEQRNLIAWLNQGKRATIPNNNWNYFPIMVQMGCKQAGLPWDREAVEARFALMEAYYLGDGWYSDGPGRPRDYYISMAFHYYGLLYATHMADVDAERCATLRHRAQQFAADFITLFSADGAAVPFGRSLTYRFAEAAFWSAVAFSDLPVFSHGVVKGIILRHLRSWLKQPIFDRDGILSVGYHTPNLVMAEDYNAPGSPYWACKLFLVLALPPEHAFWQADELPLPPLNNPHCIAHASQILLRDAKQQHVVMLTSGQLELNNFVNTEAKYTKFAYSSQFGFTLDRGRFGLNHAACDSMLVLSERDGYYRGRRGCEETVTRPDVIFSRWLPWHDVEVKTWLIPCGDGHLRLHHVTTARTLDAVEGGFAVINDRQTEINTRQQAACSHIVARNGSSLIASLTGDTPREAAAVVTPPNSSIMFAETAVIPVLKTTLAPGEHWLMSAIFASSEIANSAPRLPATTRDEKAIHIHHQDRHWTVAL